MTEPVTTKNKLGATKHFAYGSPNNPIMYACVIAIKAAGSEWMTGDFETIVKEIQTEAFNAGWNAAIDNAAQRFGRSDAGRTVKGDLIAESIRTLKKPEQA